jgi:uncharacterized protein YkwD
MKTQLLKIVLPLTLLFVSISCTKNSKDEVDTEAQIVSKYDYSSEELELMRQINEYRVSIGKNTLEIVNHISYKSEEHNGYMITNNVVNHDNFSYRANNIIQVLGAIKVGENIAYNYPTPASALEAWLNSPDHKKNIVGDYTHFGISITISSTGKKYCTNMFMKK